MQPLPSLNGVRTRMLYANERRTPGNLRLPLVIEATHSKDVAFLSRLAASNSDALKAALGSFGALLIRGFAVRTEREFSDVLTSIRGFTPMTGYFMSEPGRDQIQGAPFVFFTNSIKPTGGGVRFGGFHCENYYSPDVPGVVGFWCKRQPWLGGETAIVNTADVYDALPDSCQKKLESGDACLAFRATSQFESHLERRYGVSSEQFHAFCVENGLVLTVDGVERFGFHKPTLLVDSLTGRRAIPVNLSIEVPGLDLLVRQKMLPIFRGWKWSFHRAAWKYPEIWEKIHKGLSILEHRLRSARNPEQRRKSTTREDESTPNAPLARIRNKLTAQDTEAISEAVSRNCVLFKWKEGDIVILDNLLVAHAGMPGVGPRTLRAMILNRISLEYPIGSPVLDRSTIIQGTETLSQRISGVASR